MNTATSATANNVYKIEEYSYTRIKPWELQLIADAKAALVESKPIDQNHQLIDAIAQKTNKRNVFVSVRVYATVTGRPELTARQITVYNDRRILVTFKEDFFVKEKALANAKTK